MRMTSLYVMAAALSLTALPVGATAAGTETPAPAADSGDIAALREIDTDRLLSDPNYAAGMVEVIDRVASTVQDSERRYALQSFKALALLTSNRIPEAEAIAKEIVGTESTAAAYGHLVLITAAMVRENRLGLLEAIEAASLDPHGREAAVQVLDEPFVRSLR